MSTDKKIVRFMPKQWKDRFKKMGPLLSEEESKTIIHSFLIARAGKGAKKSEVLKVLAWAETVKIEQGLLESVLDQSLLVDWNGKECVFFLSKKGIKLAEEVIKQLDEP